MGDLVDVVLQAIAEHPEWALVVVFLIGVFDTLLIVGYFVPGTALMVGTGVLVGHGELSLGGAAAALVAGGVAGDALAYWLGSRYRDRILGWRFFRKRQKLIARLEDMTAKHGGKAVFSARFIGQIRPLVPFLAGVVSMPARRFLLYNVVSAVLSAFVHLVIGMAVGLGLSVTGAVTGRLVVLVVLAALAGWAAQLVARWLWNWATIDAPELIERWLSWAHDHWDAPRRRARVAAFLVLHLFDPHYRAAAEIAGLGLLALLSLTGVVALVGDALEGDPLAAANQAVFLFFDGLRNPWADGALAVLAALGGRWVVLALCGVVAALLALQRAWRVAGHWLLAVGLAFGSAEFILWVVDTLLPAAAHGPAPSHAFPSGQAAALLITFAYLALLSSQRFVAFAVAFVFLSLISIAQLYFGTVYVSGLLMGLLLGGIWLAVLVASTRDYLTAAHPLWSDAMGGAAIVVLALAGVLYATAFHREELVSLPQPTAEIRLSGEEWEAAGWQRLPVYRTDFAGEPEEPMNLQLAGSAESVRDAFERAGWQLPPPWTLGNLLSLLSGSGFAAGEDRPVLPRLSNGRPEALRFVKDDDRGRLVVRLWDHQYRLLDGTPIYLGTVERESAPRTFVYGLITLPPVPGGFMPALEELARDLDGATVVVRGPGWRPARADGKPIQWNGATIVERLN